MSSWAAYNNSSKKMSGKKQQQLQIISNLNYIPPKLPPPEKNTFLQYDNKSIVANITDNDKYTKKACLDYIDAILYINLEHRTDRKEHILNEIKKIDPLLSKTHRIDATLCKENGALGCSLSHIKALDVFKDNPSWNTILLVEDDFTFHTNDSNKLNSIINYMFSNLVSFDMILLGIGAEGLLLNDTPNENIKKVLSAQTTSGYIVTRSYMYTLLANYTQSSNNMKNFGWKCEWCLDQYWKKLIPYSNWYTYKNRIAHQYDNYSDIEGKEVKYSC